MHDKQFSEISSSPSPIFSEDFSKETFCFASSEHRRGDENLPLRNDVIKKTFQVNLLMLLFAAPLTSKVCATSDVPIFHRFFCVISRPPFLKISAERRLKFGFLCFIRFLIKIRVVMSIP